MQAAFILLLAGLALEQPARAATFALPSPLALEPTELALASPAVQPGPSMAPELLARGSSITTPSTPESHGLGPERARILLQSLTVPGWGQVTLGRPTAAKVFGLIEAGVWGSFVAFRIQERLRRETSFRTARLGAGIDLADRDEEFMRIVGSYISSEEYNLLVVTRDAANLYLQDVNAPDLAGYRAYIAAHRLSGADAWSWNDVESFRKYRGHRKDAQRAALRANTALGAAVANRLLAALHAARGAGKPAATKRSWNLECVPAPGADPFALQLGVRTRF